MSRVGRVLRQLWARPRLVMATGLFLLATWVLPARLAAPTRALVAWTLGGGLYLALAWTMMLRGTVEEMRSRARVEDEGAVAVLVLTIGAAAASVAAIVLELVGSKNLPAATQTPHLALAAATINAAFAIGRGDMVGSLEVGKQADIVILDVPDYRHLGYRFGTNLVYTVIKRGRPCEGSEPLQG